ncbi:MAG TPA: hypothetical protein PK765_03895 [bacterium]|nr:hypothetical protein [bacterium]
MFSVILPFLWLCVASAFVLLAFGHFVSGKPFESDAFILLSLALLPPATAAIAAIAKDAASESWMFSERTKYRYFAAAASGVIVSFFLGQSWFVGVMAFLLTFSFAFRIDARFFFVPAIILVALYPISALSDTGRAAAGGILILAEIATVTGLIRLLVDTIA